MSIWTSLASWAKAGAPSSQSVLNTGLTMLTNYRNRQNALADQKALNAYNSPLQQMQRFKEAGLNPNLIYKQTNEGAAVRSTDAIAPKIDETVLDVLGKTNNLTNRNLEQRSLMLRNDNQELQNDILRAQKDDLYDKVYYQNEVAKSTYSNLEEQLNLKRLERGQKNITNPLEAEKLKQQVREITTNNKYQSASLQQKQDINELIKKNMDAIIQGKVMENDLQKMDVEVRKELNEILDGLGSSVGGKIMEFLGKAALMYMGKATPSKSQYVPKKPN
jgi:hypothetical protein